MGSFANSLHVRSDDTESVVAEIGRILGDQGYRAAEEEPEPLGEGPSTRRLEIAESKNGWVGILDNDLMGLLTLALELSGRLESYAICVMVNDSDSWHYELFHRGRPVDGFDSPGSSPLLDLDELPEEVLELPDAGELAEAMNALGDQMPGIAEMLQALLPPEIRELQQKITAGTATPEEADKFSQWTNQLAEKTAEEFRRAEQSRPALPGANGNGKPNSKKALEDHVRHLRPLLGPETRADQVQQVLSEEATFAEEPMADFLDLLGISRFYAQLSFAYLAEFMEAELQGEGIRFSESLVFRKDRDA